MSKKCNLGLIIYEIRNLSGNLFVHFFGVIFPIVMSMIISSQATKEVPESMKQEVVTAIVITMSLIIPMAIMLVVTMTSLGLSIYNIVTVWMATGTIDLLTSGLQLFVAIILMLLGLLITFSSGKKLVETKAQ